MTFILFPAHTSGNSKAAGSSTVETSILKESITAITYREGTGWITGGGRAASVTAADLKTLTVAVSLASAKTAPLGYVEIGSLLELAEKVLEGSEQ